MPNTFDPTGFVKLMRRYINDPESFVRTVLNADPDPWQQKALRALVTEKQKRFSIRAGHG